MPFEPSPPTHWDPEFNEVVRRMHGGTIEPKNRPESPLHSLSNDDLIARIPNPRIVEFNAL